MTTAPLPTTGAAGAAADADLSGSAAVILAGGFGTRLNQVVADRPKPLISVAGHPFLSWVGRYLVSQGISRAIISTGHLGEQIKHYFSTEPVAGLKTTCSHEQEPKGTAGGFLHAINSGLRPSPSTWLVCNGDSLVLADLRPFIARLTSDHLDACILAVRMEEATRYGTLETGPDGLLRGFHEKRPGPGLINAGVYIFRAGAIAQFPAGPTLGFEYDVFPHLIACGARIGVHAVDAPFIDIGIPETLSEASTFITRHRLAFGAAVGTPC